TITFRVFFEKSLAENLRPTEQLHFHCIQWSRLIDYRIRIHPIIDVEGTGEDYLVNILPSSSLSDVPCDVDVDFRSSEGIGSDLFKDCACYVKDHVQSFEESLCFIIRGKISLDKLESFLSSRGNKVYRDHIMVASR